MDEQKLLWTAKVSDEQNLLRTAKVSAVDYENGMVSVIYNDKGGAVSAKMPMMNFNDEYYMPTVGSQVQVMLLSNGSSRGVVMGNTWQKGNAPRESGKGVYRKDFSKIPGACTAKYNDDSGEYAIQSGSILMYAMVLLKLAGATVNIDASGKIVIDTPLVDWMVPSLNILGGEDAVLHIKNGCDITLKSEEKSIESKMKSVRKEVVEAYELKAGQKIRVESAAEVSVKAETDMDVEDAVFKTTLSDILKRLEALDGDMSARK